jgi:menaquinol-cytochrome c reductase cytochrome b/c subunit
MNQREKEQYLREYAHHKAAGKPFFPYAVAKDSIMAVLVVFSIIMMSLIFGAELGPKADPTTTTYVPRPEWYFFFLFELLRVIQPAILTPVATIGVPTICMVLLFLLPFYDRGPERRPERRPVATAAGIFTIAAMAYLTYLGASAGSPNDIDMVVPPQYEAGKQAVAQSGCLACHKIGHNGGVLGPDLTEIGDKLLPDAIRRTLENPTAPMPSFANLSEKDKDEIVSFLAYLREDRVKLGEDLPSSVDPSQSLEDTAVPEG